MCNMPICVCVMNWLCMCGYYFMLLSYYVVVTHYFIQVFCNFNYELNKEIFCKYFSEKFGRSSHGYVGKEEVFKKILEDPENKKALGVEDVPQRCANFILMCTKTSKDGKVTMTKDAEKLVNNLENMIPFSNGAFNTSSVNSLYLM